MLLGGRLADLLGRRGVLVGGTVVFAAASLIGGLAQAAGLTGGPTFWPIDQAPEVIGFLHDSDDLLDPSDTFRGGTGYQGEVRL